MKSNQHQEIILDSDQVRASLPALASILDSLNAQTLSLLRRLEEAQRGDPHKYLSGGIAEGFDAVGTSRRAAAELRDVIDRVTQTLRAFDQHDQGVHTAPTTVELPVINGVPATLGLTTSDMSLAAMTTRSEDVRSAMDADGLVKRTEAAFAELDQSSIQATIVPNTEGVAAIDRSGDLEVAPVSLASVDERTRSADPPDLSVNATVSSQTPAPFADANPAPPVPAVTPTPPPPAIMPAANVKVTEDNRSWWDKLVDGFRWIGDKLSKLFNALAELFVNILLGLLILAVVVAVVFLIGLLLVKLGVIAAFSFAIAFAIAVVIIAVAAIVYEFITRLDEYRLYRGEPDGNTYLQIGLISLGSIFGISQLMEAWQGKRLLTELPLTEQERWDYGVQGGSQIILTILGIRAGFRKLNMRRSDIVLRTMPSGRGPLQPRGNPTIIRANMDDSTIRALKRENESAKLLAENGYDVYQNPGHINGKYPDLLLEGKVFDVYSPSSSNPRNIAAAIESKVLSGQTNRIVLNLDDSSVSIDALKVQLEQYPIKGLEEIIIIKNRKIIPFFPF